MSVLYKRNNARTREEGHASQGMATTMRQREALLEGCPVTVLQHVHALWQRHCQSTFFVFGCRSSHVCWADPTQQHQENIVCFNLLFRFFGCTTCGRAHYCRAKWDHCPKVQNKTTGSFACAFSGAYLEEEQALGSFAEERRVAHSSQHMDAITGTSVQAMVHSGNKTISQVGISMARLDRLALRQKKREEDEQLTKQHQREEGQEGKSTVEGRKRKRDMEEGDGHGETKERNMDAPSNRPQLAQELLGMVGYALDDVYNAGHDGKPVAKRQRREDRQVPTKESSADQEGEREGEEEEEGEAGEYDKEIARGKKNKGGQDVMQTVEVEDRKASQKVIDKFTGEEMKKRKKDDTAMPLGRNENMPYERYEESGVIGINEEISADDMQIEENEEGGDVEDRAASPGLLATNMDRANLALLARVHDIPDVTGMRDLLCSGDAFRRAVDRVADQKSEPQGSWWIPLKVRQRMERLVGASSAAAYDPYASMEVSLREFDRKHREVTETEVRPSWPVEEMRKRKNAPYNKVAPASVGVDKLELGERVTRQPITRLDYRYAVRQTIDKIMEDVSVIVDALGAGLSMHERQEKKMFYASFAIRLLRLMIVLDPINTPIKQRRLGVVVMMELLPVPFFAADYFMSTKTGEQNKVLVWSADSWLRSMKESNRLAGLIGDYKRGAHVRGKAPLSRSGTQINPRNKLAQVASTEVPLFQRTDITLWTNHARNILRAAHITGHALRGALFS